MLIYAMLHDFISCVLIIREGVMEFLLVNHPLDCPICDQAGECDLQVCVCVCEHAGVCMCMYACVRARMCVHMRVCFMCGYVFPCLSCSCGWYMHINRSTYFSPYKLLADINDSQL